MKTKGEQIYSEILEKYYSATTPEEHEQARIAQQQAQDAMDEQTREEYHAAIKAQAEADFAQLDKLIAEGKEQLMRKRLGEITQIVSLSYVARTYFGKSRAWLHQRMNGNIVNGKQARFSEAECQQLQNALHDLGRKLSSVAIV